MRRFFMCAALCGAAALAACDNDDLPSGPDEGANGSGTQAPRAVARFTVNVRASGSFRPGQPVQITLTARGHLRTSNAEVRLVLPEVAALRAGGGQRMHMHLNEAPRPDLSERLSIGRGQSLTRTANVTIPRPGFYQVIASVEQLTHDPADEEDANGLASNNVEHEVIWLWIADSGGGVTGDFDPDRIPAGMHPVPGPLTPEMEPRPGSSERASGPAGPRPGGARLSHAPIAGWVDTHATYSNNDKSGAQTPIPNAKYEYYIYKADGTYVETRGPFVTGSDGLTYTQCYTDPATGQAGRYLLRVFLENERLALAVPMAIDVGGFFSTDCGRVMVSQATTYDARTRSHIYTNLDRDIRKSDSFFGTQRDRITVRVEDRDYSTYEWHSTHNLAIDTTKDDKFRTSQVWGEYGQFVQAHEYGHAFQFHLEPTVKETYYHDCPSTTHEMNTPTFHGCALAEGFPDYYSVTVGGTFTGKFLTDIETAIYSPTTPANASTIEGAVASFLYDLTDPANETHDLTAYPGSWVANVMRTCEVQLNLWVHQRGIDHLIYCFMAQPTDVAQFNRTNGPAATAVYEPAADPEDDATRRPKIRKNYQKNLFGTTI